MEKNEEAFKIQNLVETSLDDFSIRFCVNEPMLEAMEDLKLLYYCIGPVFILKLLKPH